MTSSGIQISDVPGNQIEMSSSGFTLTATAAFTIDAGGAVTIKGSAIDFQQA